MARQRERTGPLTRAANYVHVISRQAVLHQLGMGRAGGAAQQAAVGSVARALATSPLYAGVSRAQISEIVSHEYAAARAGQALTVNLYGGGNEAVNPPVSLGIEEGYHVNVMATVSFGSDMPDQNVFGTLVFDHIPDDAEIEQALEPIFENYMSAYEISLRRTVTVSNVGILSVQQG